MQKDWFIVSTSRQVNPLFILVIIVAKSFSFWIEFWVISEL